MVPNRRSYAELSTAGVEASSAFAYWREVVCKTFVRLSADAAEERSFSGHIKHMTIGGIELSEVASGAQRIVRTPRLISTGDEEGCLMAVIQMTGRGLVEQDGRISALSIGDMAFFDSSRPYLLRFESEFSQLVVKVPIRSLALRNTQDLTARTLGRYTVGSVVSSFFTSLFEAEANQHGAGTPLVPHATGLLSAAASYAARLQPAGRAADAAARQRVIDFLRSNLADPHLDTEAVARACGMSRRSLYRLMGEGGIAGTLRMMRLERARLLLSSDPRKPIGRVATQSGFESESGFYRAFRTASGMTPAEFRQQNGTHGQ